MFRIIQGLGGALRFQNFTPLAPALVTDNLSRFRELVSPAQLETLASAYHHLMRVPDANQEVVESVAQMIQRLESKADPSAADSFTISRLVLEWGRLKETLRESAPPARGTPLPPAGDVEDSRPRAAIRDKSLRFYSDGSGGFFPPSWAHLSKEMRDSLKSLAYGRRGKMSELTESTEVHADLLMGALAGWIEQIKTVLTETGARGAGQSGLASAPSLRAPLGLIIEMVAFMSDGEDAGLSSRFWQLYGSHVDLRSAVNRLTSQRTLLATLEEGERSALDQALFDLDVAYLRVLLRPLASKTEEGAGETGNRDEAFGDTLATTLGNALMGLPFSGRAEVTASEQVQLTSAASALRILSRELSSNPPSPAVRGFLKRLSPRETLQLAQVVALIQDSL